MTRRIHRTNIALAICIAAVFAKPSIAEDDDPLPNWLSFDSVRGTFSLRLAAEEGKEAEVVTIGPILFNNVPLTNFSRRWDGMTGAGFEHPLITIAHSMGDLLQRPSFRIQIESADNQPHHIEIPIKDNSDYFGGGERFQAINQKGYLLPMTSIDRPEPKGTSTYFPVPFYYSTRGYGVWVNSTLPGEFDLNGSDRFHVRLRYQADSLEIVLFAGPRHADVLRDFNRLVGPPRLPPPWAFAPWKSRDVHRNREEILEDVEKHRALDIPGSVLVIDSPWETCYNNFELNESQFVDADAMFARMGALGFHTCLWMTPFVNRTNVQDMSGIRVEACDEFATGAAAGHFVKGKNAEPLITSWWKGEGALIDFTSDEATAWWHTLLARTAKWKPRAFKCDDGEGNFVGDAIFADGARAEAMRNQYGVFYLHAARQYLAGAFGDDHAIIARTGFTGAQQHAICWAGDNEASFAFDNGLPSVILAGQTAALSGIPFWGSDISGYFGTPDKELFIRWTQFAAFTPLMMVHMTSNLGPWDFDDEALRIYRDFAKLHTRLFPYMYQAAHEAVESGLPIIRPMVLLFPEDPRARQAIYQFAFGPDLLVAPMYQPGASRSVYLPKGEWIDFWTGEMFTGPKSFVVDVPLPRIPLFVRAGAMIELLPADVDTLIARHEAMGDDVVALDERRVLQIWPQSEKKARTLVSWDGLVIGESASEQKRLLTISSTIERNVTIEFPHQRVSGISIGGVAQTSTSGDNGRTAWTVALKADASPISVHYETAARAQSD